MKRILLVVGFLFFVQLFTACEEQLDPIPRYDVDDTSLPDSIKNGFLGQAQQIAIMNYEFPSTRFPGCALIGNSAIQPYYFALVNIYLAENIQARDSVINLYPFALPLPDQMHEIIVTVPSSIEWTNNWIYLEMETDNTDLNRLIQTYDLRVTWWRSTAPYHDSYWFTLGTEKLVSESGLSQLFNAIPEISIAEPNSLRLDGDWIRGNLSGENVLIDLEKGWGDCPSGCMAHHTWHFQVSPDGLVEYLGSSGVPIYPVGINPY